MIIGINLISLPDEKGTGAFRYLQMLFKAMEGYIIEDAHFIVYKQRQISEKYIDFPSSQNVEFVNVPMLGRGFKRILFEQTLFLRYLGSCDVLYSYCTSMPLLAKCRKVFTLHDVYYLTTKQRYGWLQRTYLSMVTKLYCKVCDKIITVSKYSYDEIKKYLRVSDDKLALTYNFVIQGTEKKLVRPSSLYDVDGNSVNIDKRFFFYVGNLQPGKNIRGMIDGFLKYMGNRDDVQLIIAGKPTTCGDRILNYVSGHKNIHYIGYQPRVNVEWLFANCLSVVLLSFCEGFGIPPIEGFSFGRPALTSNTTSLPEVVGDAGCKVNPYDISDIANGFSIMEAHCEDFVRHIPEQMMKFDPKISVETFMRSLGLLDFKVNKSS